MQLKSLLKKLSLAVVALGLVSSDLVASAPYASGTRIYVIRPGGLRGGYALADLTGQYNLYTASDLLTNGTLVANTQLLKASLNQQTKLMDVRLASLSSHHKIAQNDKGTHYVALAGNGASGKSAGSEGYNWGVWLSGRYTDFKAADQYFGVKGDSYAGMLGADYRVMSSLIVGLAVSFEHAQGTTTFLKEKIKNDGYGVTPYVKFNINEHFDVDLFGGYTYINTKTSHANVRYDRNVVLQSGTVSGKTHSDQWHGVFALNAHTVFADALTVHGKVGINYASRRQKGFNQKFSFSTATMAVNDAQVKGSTADLSQAFGDLRLGYMVTENVEPYVKGGYAYDISYKKYGKTEYDNQGGAIKQKTDRNNYTYGGGLNFVFGQFQAAADYEHLQGARKFNSNTYLLLVRYNF